MQDHYQVLDVGRHAEQAEILKAYRGSVRRCHPDLNPDDEDAKRQFHRVQIAFDVLSDPVKRRAYDPDEAPLKRPRAGKSARRTKSYRAPSMEEVILQRSAWHAQTKKAFSPVMDDESAIRLLKIATMGVTVAAYLGLVLFVLTVPGF